jgi:hypothetical protein
MLLSVGDTSWPTLYVERDLHSKDCFEPVVGVGIWSNIVPKLLEPNLSCHWSMILQ